MSGRKERNGGADPLSGVPRGKETAMQAMQPKELSPYHVRCINAALGANLRVEVVPTDKGIKVYTVKRKELNN